VPHQFYGSFIAGYCSDKCADAAHTEQRAAETKRRTEDRASCDHCAKPMTAAHSTKKFCSPRCPAAAFRRDMEERKSA
jgi:hypothetical protein